MNSSRRLASCTHSKDHCGSSCDSITACKYARTGSRAVFIRYQTAATGSLKPCCGSCDKRIWRCTK